MNIEDFENIEKETKRLLDKLGASGVGLSGAVWGVAIVNLLQKKGIITKEETEKINKDVADTCALITIIYKKESE